LEDFLLLLLLLSSFFFFSLSSSPTLQLNLGKMSVIGIDFGNYNTCVAVARNRGIDIVVNEVSNRFTP